MNNSKIVLSKATSAIFLAIVLVAGTVTAISPSFITGANAQTQPYYEYNSYGPPEYSSYKPDYKLNYPSYDKKDDRRDKSKDSSKGVSINKIKCINTNLNINGNNAGNVSIGNKGQGYLGANSYGGYSGEGYGNNKQGKGFDCTINNNNTNTNIGGGGNQTIPPVPPEQRATLNVTKLVTCQQADSSGLVPSIQQISLDCDDLLALITEDQFNITVTDTNVSPSNFNGSENGTLVTLDAGPFTVTEEPYDSVAEDVETLEDIQTDVTGPFPSFSGDCTQIGIGSFSATGDIAAGGQETCNIVNNFVITEKEEERAQLNVTKLVTCDVEEDGDFAPSIQQVLNPCALLNTTITEDQFNIFVTATNSNPSEFTGSENGTLVTLDAGFYQVAETPDPSILDDLDTLEEDLDIVIDGPFPSFTGNCLPAPPLVFSTTGNIAAGEFQTCNIENNFIIEVNEEEEEFTGGPSSITTQGTADSPELTATEKMTKLKKQWLDLLP